MVYIMSKMSEDAKSYKKGLGFSDGEISMREIGDVGGLLGKDLSDLPKINGEEMNPEQFD
jgi:hypothetical protein